MSQKTFNLLAGVIFAAVALLHLSRLYFGWSAVLKEATWTVPMWVSWLGLVVAAGLAYFGNKLCYIANRLNVRLGVASTSTWTFTP